MPFMYQGDVASMVDLEAVFGYFGEECVKIGRDEEVVM